MIAMTLRAAKEGFFDRTRVKNAVDAGTRRVLSRFGAFVRTRARTSIRKSKGTSAPGSPPYSHVGLLRKFILFAHDPQRNSVVIGPTRLRPESEAPRLLEYGGWSTRTIQQKTRRLRHRPRPFMAPAFAQEQKNLPPLWQNAVR